MRIATRSLLALLAASVLTVSGISTAESASGPTGLGDRPSRRTTEQVATSARTASLKRRPASEGGGYYYGSVGPGQPRHGDPGRGRPAVPGSAAAQLGRHGARLPPPAGPPWARRDLPGAGRREPRPPDAGRARAAARRRLRRHDELGRGVQPDVLADQGAEEIHLGAGDDWVNGFLQRDQVWGGDGNDFIRGGEGPDCSTDRAARTSWSGSRATTPSTAATAAT